MKTRVEEQDVYVIDSEQEKKKKTNNENEERGKENEGNRINSLIDI